MPDEMLPLAIYYEQPNWFRPLFAELDRRGTPYVKLDAVTHSYSPAEHPEEKYSLVFNRMSPSAWNRGHGDQIFYTGGFLEHLEMRGVRVINGVQAFRSELSKAGQLSLMEEIGKPYPKARVIHRAAQAAAASEGLRFPVVVKPNIGGSGAGVKRFDHLSQLEAASALPAGDPDELVFGLDSTALVQEFIPGARQPHRARGSAEREISVRDQGTYHGRNVRPLPGGYLPHRFGRRPEPRGVCPRRAQKRHYR